MKRLTTKVSIAFTGAFLMAVFLVGCVSIVGQSISYSLPNGGNANLNAPYALVVKNFSDVRPASERIQATPIAGTKSGDNWFSGSLSREIPKMIAKDINDSGIFKSSVFQEDWQGKAKPNTLFMDGKIHAFQYADGITAKSAPIEIRVKLSVRILDWQNKVLWTSPERESLGFPYFTSLHWNESFRQGFPHIIKAFADNVRDLKQDISQFTANRLSPQVQVSAAPVTTTPSSAAIRESSFPGESLDFKYPPSAPRPDDVAVIIGNANYRKLGRDIPNVTPAYADAEGFRVYAKQALGIAEDNIIFIKDATQKDMVATFGSESSYRGRLFRFLTGKAARVFVYYAGHGAPGSDGNNMLVPSDAEASLIELNGYRLKTLYRNLSQLPAESITVVLESCFSGASQAGSVINNASPIFMRAKDTGVPPNITVISAGAANQIASWEEDKSHSLFSKYFLRGMSGDADQDGNKKVSWQELRQYLSRTVTRAAMRTYGRDQIPQVVVAR